jgi:group I intron endonuclease
MRCSGIYRIDLGNGNFYIGSAVNLARRKRDHRSELIRGVHTNRIMQNCWNKYNVFEFTVLEECQISELLLREQFWIDSFFSNPKNVNIAPIAGSTLGVTHSPEARANMSASQKGKPKSAEHRAKIAAANKKRIYSVEHRKRISDRNKGKVWTAEARAKMSAINKGKVLPPRSPEHCAKISAGHKKRRAMVKMQQPMEEMEHGKECS